MPPNIEKTTSKGEAYETDRVRAAKTACAFMGMVSKAACYKNKTLDVRDFTDLLERDFAEVRKEAKGEEAAK